MQRWLLYMCLIASAGCAAKLATKDEDGEPIDADAVQSGKFSSKSLADAVTETTVDATQETEWQYLDLDSGEAVAEDAGWDLAFSRFRVRSNGGESGDAGVEVAVLEGQDFEALEAVPDDVAFEMDRPDGPEDANEDPDNTFNSGQRNWYTYDVNTHVLSPADLTYVVHSSEGRYFKLRFIRYYSDNGTPAMLTFLWTELSSH